MFERQFSVYRQIKTTKSPEEVFQAVEHSLRLTVGGTITRQGNVFKIYDGKQNLNLAYAADINATVTLLQSAPDMLEINGDIELEPNQFFWLMGILSLFCLWFLLAFNIMYFVMDPTRNYQLALDRINLDENASAAPKPFGV